MKKDQLLTRRRALLAAAGALTAAGTAGVLAAVTGSEPGPAAPTAPAPGPGARRPLKSSAYRLQPLAGYGPRRAAPARTPVRHTPLRCLSGQHRTLLLTFDDGPDPRYTPHILDILAEHRARAMFFVCGVMARTHPGLLSRMADEGHAVGNHTWSHPLLTRLTPAAIRSQMERTSDVVEETYGERPEWFRAPYGAWNRAAFRIGAELGMEPLAWSVDTLDWTTPGVAGIARRVASGAAPGAVVLSHDAGGDRSQSVLALRAYLPRLLDSGYRVTVPSRKRS